MTIREFEIFTLVAALVAMSQQVRAWLAWPIGLLIVTRTMDGYSTGPVLQYLLATARTTPRGGNYYSSEKAHLRPLGRLYRVFYEGLKEGRQTFRFGWRTLWYAPEKFASDAGKPEIAIGSFSYVRWTIDWDDLLRRVAAHEDASTADFISESRSRFRVERHGGRAGDLAGQGATPSYAKSSGSINLLSGAGARILHWRLADLADPPRLALDSLSLRPEVVAATDRIRAWIGSKDWCEERGIPWRLGLALTGKPGTGKTSVARAIAVEHNLPIHVFDIAALANYEMRAAWSRMVEDAPCMALIEDIDAVFRGRERVGGAVTYAHSGASPLTYDCLLNCISGVECADGVLLVVTSNHAEHIDPAMMRRGRLDLHVEVLGMDFAGRLKMAKRILRDDPALAARMAHEADDVTPADFQERCIEAALSHRERTT